ncbi:DUF4426 domain-containing protein [Halomonas aquatica]|uniref:DUF4426 domain-containing protein n=1 Tax=Halomonas aquatica TaxID=3151123 RepID=A0ABV1NH01_9GAMM
MMRHRLAALLMSLMLLATLPAQAQQFEQVGDYQIHYSAVSTSFLPEAVAREHGIQRSQIMALLNVSVMEQLEDGSTRPVTASVDGSSSGLEGDDSSPLAFRSLRIDDTPTQVAVFRIREDEPMRFDLRVRYDRNAEPAEVSFIQRFYMDH